MGKFGDGYGSECHLLRYLGRHRLALNKAVQEVTGSDDVRWLDFPFTDSWQGKAGYWPDQEWRGLDFLPKDSEVVRTWRERWPHGSGIMNWDAVGQVRIREDWEWFLVEAKGHLSELASSCAASASQSIALIEGTLSATKTDLDVPPEADWKTGYYQYANRLAVLNHLAKSGVKARLLFIYFCGDVRPDSFKCPRNSEEWRDALVAQDRHLQIPESHLLSSRVHKLFLPVWSAKN